MQDESLVKLKEQLEYLFMRVIIGKLKADQMQPIEAKTLAQEFLKAEPFASIEDAHSKVDGFVAKNPLFSLLKEYSDIYYDEEHLDEKMELMKKHIKANNLDEAMKVIQQ